MNENKIQPGKTTKAFEDSQDMVDAIRNAPTDLAVLSKRDGTIVAINPQGASVLGQVSSDLIGIRIFELLSPIVAEHRKHHFDKVIESGEPVRFEEELSGKWFHESIYPIFDLSGNVRRLAIFSHDITEQKQTEQALEQREEELKIKTRHLEEVNTTLRVLLKKREQNKQEIADNLLANVKELIAPYIERIKRTDLDDHQKALLSILKANLNEITSPFIRNISQKYLNLTPTEIRIANMIKHGSSSKKIAEFLNISPRTVDTHRKNIRKKLGLRKKRENLRSYLLSLH